MGDLMDMDKNMNSATPPPHFVPILIITCPYYGPFGNKTAVTATPINKYINR